MIVSDEDYAAMLETCMAAGVRAPLAKWRSNHGLGVQVDRAEWQRAEETLARELDRMEYGVSTP